MTDQPARRFRQPQQQQDNDQAGNAANQEHDLPAEKRHQPGADLPGGHQPDREDHLVEQEETAAALRARQLADIGRRDRHLAADADALHEAAEEERRETAGEGAAEAHHRHDGDRRRARCGTRP